MLSALLINNERLSRFSFLLLRLVSQSQSILLRFSVVSQTLGQTSLFHKQYELHPETVVAFCKLSTPASLPLRQCQYQSQRTFSTATQPRRISKPISVYNLTCKDPGNEHSQILTEYDLALVFRLRANNTEKLPVCGTKGFLCAKLGRMVSDMSIRLYWAYKNQN